MAWRLGLDIGTNSIGWAALSLIDDKGNWKPTGIADSGVRIFSDGRNPKDKQSLAAARRLPRQQRRMRDRYGVSPLQTCLDRLATSLAMVFMGERKNLELPGPALALFN